MTIFRVKIDWNTAKEHGFCEALYDALDSYGFKQSNSSYADVPLSTLKGALKKLNEWKEKLNPIEKRGRINDINRAIEILQEDIKWLEEQEEDYITYSGLFNDN